MTDCHLTPRRHRVATTGTALAIIVASVTACSASHNTSTASTTRAATTSTTSSTSDGQVAPVALGKGQVDHVVGATFQYGAFQITVGHLVYDSTNQQALVGLQFRNLSGNWAQSAIAGELLVGGASVPFSGQPYDVAPGAAVDSTGTSSNVASDPVKEGRIRWGDVGRNRPVIALDGSGVVGGWLPTPVAISGWAHIGKYAVEATGGEILAGRLGDGIQAAEHRRILRVIFDLYAARGSGVSGFSPASNLTLRTPDGTLLDAVDGSPLWGPISWTSRSANWVEFAISDKFAGSYGLELASIGKLDFGVIRPELIVRRPIAFRLADLRSSAAPKEPLVMPDLTSPSAPATGAAFDRPLSVGTMNVPGFLYRPTRLRWDPAAQTATMDGIATYIQTESSAGGLLSSKPQFGFSELLVSDGRPYTGIVTGPTQVDPVHPTPISLQFLSVKSLDPTRAALYIGARDALAASMPLGPGSSVALYPPAPASSRITAPTVTAGDWTVRMRTYRLGLLQTAFPPAPGRRDLEVSMDVTAASAAHVGALGLSFTPKYQVLLADPSGYDTQAVADSGYVEQRRGQTLRLSVTFEVPETWKGGSTGFVLRSHSEIGELATSYVETRFLAQLGAAGDAAGSGL